MRVFISVGLWFNLFLCCCSADKIDDILTKLCAYTKSSSKIHEVSPKEREKIVDEMGNKLKKKHQNVRVDLITQAMLILNDKKNYKRICIDKLPISKRKANVDEIQTASATNDTSLLKSAKKATILAHQIDGEKTSENSVKRTQVQTIKNKLEQMVTKYLKNDSAPDYKNDIIQKIKTPLRTAFHNKSDSFMKIIDQSVNIALDNVLKNNVRRSSESELTKSVNNSFVDVESLAEIEKVIPFSSKQTKIQSVISKMEAILKRKMSNGSLLEQTQYLLAEKKKILDLFTAAFQRKNNGTSEVNTYVKLIKKGLDIAVQNILHNSERRMMILESKHPFSINHTSLLIDKMSLSEVEALKPSLTKETQIHELLLKMEEMLRKKITENSTPEQTRLIADEIVDQFVTTFRQRYYNNSKKLGVYSNLVQQGMNAAVRRVINDNIRRMERLAPGKNDFSSLIGIEALSEVKELRASSRKPVIFEDSQGDCRNVLTQTCNQLKLLDKFICDHDWTYISIHQMCDGNLDCPNGNDEKNCIAQVIGKIHNATELMATVENSYSCFQYMINNSFLSERGKLLATLLNTQVSFLKKYGVTEFTPSTLLKDDYLSIFFNKIANDVALVLKNFTEALRKSLCEFEKGHNKLRDSGKDDKIQPVSKEITTASTKWRAGSCECNEQICMNMSCDPQCKRFCYQAYSLQSFICPAIEKGQKSISLDLICDGKHDCSDQTDEINCREGTGMSRLQATKYFDKSIESLKTKLVVEEYDSALAEIREMQKCIQSLQKIVIKEDVDIETVKETRNECFGKLRNIYKKILDKGMLSLKDVTAVYEFLIRLGSNLITALKLTNTGNRRISEECFCRGSKCAQTECSEHCVRICSIKEVITTYHCNSLDSNVSVPIDSICNGNINCPNGEDELRCSPEVCRIHFLKLLQYDVEKVTRKYYGINFTGVFATWRAKLLSDIAVMEKLDHLSPQKFKEFVTQTLNDLGLAYASSKVQHNPADRKKMIKLSQRVIEFLKACTY